VPARQLLHDLLDPHPTRRYAARRVVVEAAIAAAAAAGVVNPPPDPLDWEAIDHLIVTGNVMPGRDDEIVAAVTFLPEEGFVVVFAVGADAWEPAAAVGGLMRVRELKVEEVVGGPVRDVVVVDEYSELTGALYRQQRLVILRWVGDGLRTVFTHPLLQEQYSWDPPMGFREMEETEVILRRGVVETRVVWTRARRDARGDYEEIARREQQARYRWNGRSGRFEPASSPPGFLSPATPGPPGGPPG